MSDLKTLVAAHKIGQTADYWLTKRNFLGEPDQVALIFGIWGDFEFCSDLATLYMQKYPGDTYYCMPANQE